LLDISASDSRERLQAGLSIDGLVPDVVRHYIAQQKLYV
jgi:nicotinic acid mononucleotide adenylyltransferase